MRLILCVDDQGGLTFHHRRQSQDRAVRADILQMCGDTKLWVTAYTAQQFDAEQRAYLMIVKNGFEDTALEDFAFLEDAEPESYMHEADQIILYHWNRRYPADRKVTLPLTGWNCKERTEFPGYSHEKITKEVYTR